MQDKIQLFCDFQLFKLVRVEGLEPPRPCGHQILSPYAQVAASVCRGRNGPDFNSLADISGRPLRSVLLERSRNFHARFHRNYTGCPCATSRQRMTGEPTGFLATASGPKPSHRSLVDKVFRPNANGRTHGFSKSFGAEILADGCATRDQRSRS